MAILISPYFFAINTYAEGNNVASTSTLKKVNIASGSDVSFDVEELDDEDEEEDNLTDYPEEPEADPDKNIESGESGNSRSSEIENLGENNVGGETQKDLSIVPSDFTNETSLKDGNLEEDNETDVATSSNADETNNETEEQISNINNDTAMSTPSNIVPKLGSAPSVPFIPLGAPVSVGTWGTIPCMYDSSTYTLTLTGATGLTTGIGASSGSVHCFDPGSLYMALTNETIFGSTGTGSLSKDQIREIKKVKFVEGTAKVKFGTGTSLENIFKDYRPTPDLEYPWRDLEEVDLSGADFSNITSLHSTFDWVEKLKTITFPSSSFGSNITTTERCFFWCGDLTNIIHLDQLNTSSVDTMNSMFCKCTSLTSINLSNFNTSNVTDMSQMFYLCKKVTSLNLSSFDTRSVNTMESMFRECIALTSITYGTYWDTGNVTTMEEMFRETLSMSIIDVSNYKFECCTTMEEMFCMAKGDFSVKNVSKLKEVILPTSTSFATVMEMMRAFQGCTELVSINANVFNTTAATNYSELFAGCEKLKELDLTNMSVSSTDSSYSDYMFGGSSMVSVSYSAPPINKITLGVNFVLPTGSDTGLVDKAWGGSDSTTYIDTASMLSDHGTKSAVVTYTAPSSPTPTPAPPSGGGGSSGGGGGGGSVDPAGKPLDPQIVSPGIVTNPDFLVNPNTNVIPGTPVPNTTNININYDSSTTKKVVVCKVPSVNYDESDNLRLYLTGEDGVTYLANYGFFDVEVKNINSDQNGTIDTYYVNESSILVTGWIETANQNRYFMENAEINNIGKMCHGWKRIVNDWYYFDYDGKMMRDTKTYDGFTVDKDGKMTNPAYLDKALINGKQKRTVYTMEKSYKHD